MCATTFCEGSLLFQSVLLLLRINNLPVQQTKTKISQYATSYIYSCIVTVNVGECLHNKLIKQSHTRGSAVELKHQHSNIAVKQQF